jgi:hypothetical protein
MAIPFTAVEQFAKGLSDWRGKTSSTPLTRTTRPATPNRSLRGGFPRTMSPTYYRCPSGRRADLVLATSFGLLMISPLIADIWFAVAAGVLLSAFINAFLFVPALTVLAGKEPTSQAAARLTPTSRPGRPVTFLRRRPS